MGRVDSKCSPRARAIGDGNLIEARKLDAFVFRIIVFAAFVVLFFIGASHLPAHSQSGRQKTPSPSPTPNNNTRTHQASKPASKSNTKETSSDDTDDVVRVTSHLVPVPTTVVDARGVAIANLRLEDFELSIDGQPKPISDITRAESPVRMAM